MTTMKRSFATALLVAAAACAVSSPALAFSGSGCFTQPSLDRSVKAVILDLTSQLAQISVHSERKACMLYGRGLLHQLDGHSDLAAADYTGAIGWMEYFPDAYAARADAYEDLGQHDRAAQDYAQASNLAQESPRALNDRCWARAVRGRPLDRALADCNESLRQEPDDFAALGSRCLVHFRMGDYEAAIADCDGALKLAPAAPPMLYLRGLAKIRAGDAAGGNADIAAAKVADYRIAEKFALYGVTP